MNLELEDTTPIIYSDVPLNYEDWFLINEDSLLIEFAETGLDRERHFDFERETEKKYDKYLENWELIK